MLLDVTTARVIHLLAAPRQGRTCLTPTSAWAETVSSRVFSAARTVVHNRPVTAPPHGIVAIVDVGRSLVPDEMVQALTRGGVRCAEVRPAEYGLALLERWRRYPEAIVGLNVRTAADARDAIAAGARFLTTPTLSHDVLRAAAGSGVPVVCKAISPRAVRTAHRAGAAVVSIPGSSNPGGPDYARLLRSALPEVPLLPAINIGLDGATTYSALGCVGAGVTGELFGTARKSLVLTRQWDELESRARAYTRAWEDGLAQQESRR